MSLLLRRRSLLPKQITTSFNPLTQVTPLHAVWAGDPLWTPPSDGSAVTSMRNQSGGGDPTQATSGLRPLYRASVSQLGGRPAVEFDGIDDFLSFDVTDIPQTFKMLLVFRTLALVNASRAIGTGGSTSRGFGLNATHAQWQVNTGTSAGGGATTVNTNGHVMRWNAAGGSTQVWIEGTSIISASGGTGALTNWVLGSGEGGNPMSVQIGFNGIYSSATSDTDLAQLASDLKSHYAL